MSSFKICPKGLSWVVCPGVYPEVCPVVCLRVHLSLCLSICYVCMGAHRGQKRVSNPLELGICELSYVGTGNQTWVLTKGSKCKF